MSPWEDGKADPATPVPPPNSCPAPLTPNSRGLLSPKPPRYHPGCREYAASALSPTSLGNACLSSRSYPWGDAEHRDSLCSVPPPCPCPLARSQDAGKCVQSSSLYFCIRAVHGQQDRARHKAASAAGCGGHLSCHPLSVGLRTHETPPLLPQARMSWLRCCPPSVHGPGWWTGEEAPTQPKLSGKPGPSEAAICLRAGVIKESMPRLLWLSGSSGKRRYLCSPTEGWPHPSYSLLSFALLLFFPLQSMG